MPNERTLRVVGVRLDDHVDVGHRQPGTGRGEHLLHILDPLGYFAQGDGEVHGRPLGGDARGVAAWTVVTSGETRQVAIFFVIRRWREEGAGITNFPCPHM